MTTTTIDDESEAGFCSRWGWPAALSGVLPWRVYLPALWAPAKERSNEAFV